MRSTDAVEIAVNSSAWIQHMLSKKDTKKYNQNFT